MTDDANEPHAFISYVHEDAGLVDELESVLTASGIKVWRDVRDLWPGDSWKAEIRKAIKGDTLAFLPVFSKTSVNKAKTVMNEELRLAIDEYRLMPPGRPWILSVRLEEVNLPDFDLGAGQTLSDLNWTDFFGAHKTTNTMRLVVRVQALLGSVGPSIQAQSDAAAAASSRVRGPLISNLVREGASDAAKASEARRLTVEETRSVVEAIGDEDRFPLSRPEGNLMAGCVERAHAINDLVAPLAEVALELGSASNDAELARKVIESLARASKAHGRSGEVVQWLQDLRTLPTLRVMFAGALGAVAHQNAVMFAGFVAEPSLDIYGRKIPVSGVVSPWDPYGSDFHLAQILWWETRGNELTPDLMDAYMAGQVRRSNDFTAADLLHAWMAPHVGHICIDADDYDELFQRTEAMIALVTMDRQSQEAGAPTVALADNWLGRFVRNERYSQETTPALLAGDVAQQGSRWWPVAGGLFGGDIGRAREALAMLEKEYVEARAQRRY